MLIPRLRRKVEILSINMTYGSDIFVVGYPKSGNTWFQNLVAGIVYGVDLERAQDSLIQELVPDVHFKNCYKRHSDIMFFKSHKLPVPEYKRVVYLLRDGRDVMVSYFHHLLALGRNPDLLKMVRDGEGLDLPKWHFHVQQWFSNPYNTQMIVIKYEDLMKDPIQELTRFCAFVGLPGDASLLREVSAKASFTNMQRRERLFGWADTRWPKDKSFVRRGVVGSFKDEMPAEVLAEFLRDAQATLKSCGYI